MRQLDPGKALVLFSGGQDSSIALAYALDKFDRVETLGFDYGQRHAAELGARAAIRRALGERFALLADKLGEDTLVDLGALSALGDTAMTAATEIFIDDTGLPTTFVPGRNLAFLVIAGALAYRRDAGVLVAGMCEADYSGYPDCRQDAIAAQEQALQLGMDATITVDTPLMTLTKADSWRLAEGIGGVDLVDLINEHSHTCYLGVRAKRHAWGYGCGTCPACALRARGWDEYKAAKLGQI
ncbi:MAG: 7-cyano-7-deazaguanine synthase QueC [Pseudomonadota bacterium]